MHLASLDCPFERLAISKRSHQHGARRRILNDDRHHAPALFEIEAREIQRLNVRHDDP
jgi:hypothetical protein